MIEVKKVRWVLGDTEETTHATTTVQYRPLFYHTSDSEVIRVGSISPEYAGLLMDALHGGVE